MSGGNREDREKFIELAKFYSRSLRRTANRKNPPLVRKPQNQTPALTAIEPRRSILIQAMLTEIGVEMGFSIWVPKADKKRVLDATQAKYHAAFLDELPLNYDDATLDTIAQIDVLWLKNKSIVRAFEVEHTTAVYSGLLRMADLLALQPNMDIRLHIVAPDNRRKKVFREMLRPVFCLLDRGPLARSCTFIAYSNINAITRLEHLSHLKDGILEKYEEQAGP